jgi:very-short-patch-repair endonuclease
MPEFVGRLPRLLWLPGAAKRAVVEAGQQIRAAGFSCPDGAFFMRLAERAEDYAEEEFADIDVSDGSQDRFIAGKIDYINRLAAHGPDEMVLIAEPAETPAQTMLGCVLALMGNDGYNALTLNAGWNSRPDPSWGTLFCPQVPIASCRPDYIFKVCHRGQYRVLAVECDPSDRSPGEAEQRLGSDRALLANGVPVMRFTDREIAADTEACVDEISSTLSEMVDALLAEAGEIRGGPTRWLRESMTPVGKRRPT